MIRTSAETYWEVYGFLMHEAQLLDEHREREWLDSCCAEEVTYLMPVRETRERGAGDGFSDEMFYFEEDRGSLELRVRRLETEYAWAEDPPSRTRHFVTNVRAELPALADPAVATAALSAYVDAYTAGETLLGVSPERWQAAYDEIVGIGQLPPGLDPGAWLDTTLTPTAPTP